jgi:hypothetical protein
MEGSFLNESKQGPHLSAQNPNHFSIRNLNIYLPWKIRKNKRKQLNEFRRLTR